MQSLFAVALVASLSAVARGAALGGDKYLYENAASYWHDGAHGELREALKERPGGVAKNVILFLGDGMGPASVTAARILAGQKLGKSGEEFDLSFDKFPYTGLVKTYSVDKQVTDSASAATAFLCGVKTNRGVLGLNAAAKEGNCSSATGANVDSILRWSASAGKSTGIVTTTRITHATPAGAYAHCPNRDWETDSDIPDTEKSCEDIALQLIRHNKDINVLLGGGRANFYPENFPDPDPDPEFNVSKTHRKDGLNLIQDWINDKAGRGIPHKFIYNNSGLDDVNVTDVDFLLGLFSQSHMSFDVNRNVTREPALHEMAEKAIGILRKNGKGYFLLVEGGRIDSAHHDSQASKALHDVLALARAVETAVRLTDRSDTLILVTADHSHVMSIAGYASRGNPILGISDLGGSANLERPLDLVPYTTIVYGNGPGFTSPRANLTSVDTANPEYTFQSAVHMESETHGGEDVAVYAIGPQSFLFSGVHENSYLPIAMAYASCVGPYADGLDRPCAKADVKRVYNDGARISPWQPILMFVATILCSKLY